MTEFDTRDQDVDLRCLVDEEDVEHPMVLRYGVTPFEASRGEPLDVALSQEEPELTGADDGVWVDVEPSDPLPSRTRSAAEEDPDAVLAAEASAMHDVI